MPRFQIVSITGVRPAAPRPPFLIELGSASDDALLAAALLWRVFYSVITLPLGALTLSRFRKASGDVGGDAVPETLARPG